MDWEKEAYRLKSILNQYNIDEKEKPYVSDQEIICLKEIERLRKYSETVAPLDQEQVDILEKLTKVLERERNKPKKDKKPQVSEEKDVGKLLKIATGEEN